MKEHKRERSLNNNKRFRKHTGERDGETSFGIFVEVKLKKKKKRGEEEGKDK